MLKISKDLFDLFYPVGIFVETTNANWSPSNAGWYGTWTREDDGTALVSYKSSDTFNKTIGSVVGNETHRHDFKIGLLMHWGSVIADNFSNIGAYSYSQNKYSKSNGNDGTASQMKNNAVQEGGSSISETLRYSLGDTDTASSVQPSKIVYRWHRTA